MYLNIGLQKNDHKEIDHGNDKEEKHRQRQRRFDHKAALFPKGSRKCPLFPGVLTFCFYNGGVIRFGMVVD